MTLRLRYHSKSKERSFREVKSGNYETTKNENVILLLLHISHKKGTRLIASRGMSRVLRSDAYIYILIHYSLNVKTIL